MRDIFNFNGIELVDSIFNFMEFNFFFEIIVCLFTGFFTTFLCSIKSSIGLLYPIQTFMLYFIIYTLLLSTTKEIKCLFGVDPLRTAVLLIRLRKSCWSALFSFHGFMCVIKWNNKSSKRKTNKKKFFIYLFCWLNWCWKIIEEISDRFYLLIKWRG